MTTVYVRYIGTKACFTTDSGNFVMVDRDELNSTEREACERGGDDVPARDSILFLANEANR